MIKDRIGPHSVLLGEGKKLPRREKVRKMLKYYSGIPCQIRHINSTYGVYDSAALATKRKLYLILKYFLSVNSSGMLGTMNRRDKKEY